MTGGRILVYVQHLLGTGHLVRAALLADALTHAGHIVTLVSGGYPVPGLRLNSARFVQLPAVAAADLGFKSLVDVQGRPVDDAFRQARSEFLLETWRDADPQLLLVELFPFGRRQMRFELVPLLEAARGAEHPPLVVSSVRDVLGGGQADPQRQLRMLALFDRYFDHVLVHGDPALVPFERSFAHVKALGSRLHYTGYVVGHPPAGARGAGGAGLDEVIVSAGGGAVGRQLLETALRARPLSVLSDRPWRILVGPGIDDVVFGELLALARELNGNGAVVERNRPDFPALLARCWLSVSQAGYNTVMDTLQAGARAVMVPFAGGSEVEQSLRARVLAEHGWIDMLEEDEMTPTNLARAIDRAAARAPLAQGLFKADGARTSAGLITRWLAEHAP